MSAKIGKWYLLICAAPTLLFVAGWIAMRNFEWSVFGTVELTYSLFTLVPFPFCNSHLARNRILNVLFITVYLSLIKIR